MANSCTPIAGLRSEGTALVAETTLSFAKVGLQVGAVGHALSAAGLRTGDRVALATAHRASFYSCFAGCFASGFPVAILDPAAATDELALMLGKAKPAALIADESILLRLSQHTEAALPGVIWGVGLNKTNRKLAKWLPGWFTSRDAAPHWSSLADILADERDPTYASAANESPAYIMFTSGTTSKPKAVVISRAALVHHVGTLSRVFGYGKDAALLCYLPTHHTDGLVHGVAASLLTGMSVVHPGQFTPSSSLEQVLRSNKISHFLTVPTMLAMIKRTWGDSPGLFRYEGFCSLISTAGFLDEQLWRDFEDLFRIRISNFYGMTETVSGSLYCGPGDDTYRFGTLGKPVDADVRIVSDSGELAPDNTIGELQISGTHLMSGYLDDPRATQAVIMNGWLSTGDLFSRDEEGIFRFKGRLKNIIKRGGITVYPEDIRNVVNAMPGILEVEVVGLPNAMFEQLIAVCAVVEDGIVSEKIRDWCREGLSPERRPDRIELLDKLPRGPSGKVMRDALLTLLRERKSDSVGSSTSVGDRVIRIAAKTFAVEASALNETSSPETVAEWDSYASMEFVLALEKEFAIRLKPRAIMRMRDIGKAIEIVTAAVVELEDEK